ncbi:MAG TPA: hypothetical protein VG936_16665 [Lacunisphaera sp.]|nr:hypothetical protein [Lacunisphaera sp.]
MIPRPWVRAVLVACLAAGLLDARERNVWPFAVEQLGPSGEVQSGEYLGPLVFTKTNADGSTAEVFRPLFLRQRSADQEMDTLLYPLVTWRTQADEERAFSLFELVNFKRYREDSSLVRNFDLWPFYFSHETADPTESYHALFPLRGTLKYRFGKDRIDFTLFPLYARVGKSGMETTHIVWPFLRFIDGAGNHGFEFWPLFGHRGRPRDYDSRFFLWPLGYRSARHLDEAQPTLSVGVLPFYTRDTGPGFISENYAWPFFGYTHRTAPQRYDERRYLWPFLVQGRGDQRRVNRWAPLYTHSVVKDLDKTWVAWPLFRHATWQDTGVAQEKNQFLYFIYWSQTQRSLTNPDAVPANKTHVWPLWSSWDNGAGRRQVQVLSPFEVFFPTNEPIRELYTPLFALYRYDRTAPDTVRQSWLFHLVSWKRSPVEREFTFGPFLHLDRTVRTTQISLGRGLINWTRAAGSGWKVSVFDFRAKESPRALAAQTP